MKNKIYFLLLLFLISFTAKSQYTSKWGVGVSASNLDRYEFTYGFIDHYFMPQLHLVYKPSSHEIISVGGGKLFANNLEIDPIWTTVDYLRIKQSDDKRRVKFIYGGQAHIAIGKFVYAARFEGGRYVEYFKRFLVGISPQVGININTGKKSFISTTLSAGGAIKLLKISQAPAGSISSDRLQVPINISVRYSYLF